MTFEYAPDLKKAEEELANLEKVESSGAIPDVLNIAHALLRIRHHIGQKPDDEGMSILEDAQKVGIGLCLAAAYETVKRLQNAGEGLTLRDVRNSILTLKLCIDQGTQMIMTHGTDEERERVFGEGYREYLHLCKGDLLVAHSEAAIEVCYEAANQKLLELEQYIQNPDASDFKFETCESWRLEDVANLLNVDETFLFTPNREARNRKDGLVSRLASVAIKFNFIEIKRNLADLKTLINDPSCTNDLPSDIGNCTQSIENRLRDTKERIPSLASLKEQDQVIQQRDQVAASFRPTIRTMLLDAARNTHQAIQNPDASTEDVISEQAERALLLCTYAINMSEGDATREAIDLMRSIRATAVNACLDKAAALSEEFLSGNESMDVATKGVIESFNIMSCRPTPDGEIPEGAAAELSQLVIGLYQVPLADPRAVSLRDQFGRAAKVLNYANHMIAAAASPRNAPFPG